MKNYNYMSAMNRKIHMLKFISIILISSFTTGNVIGANKSNVNKILKGIVRDAHTNKPINAAQINVLNERNSATTNEKGEFQLNINSPKATLSIFAYEFNLREYPVQGKDSVIIELYPTAFSNYYKDVDVITNTTRNSTLAISAVGKGDINNLDAISPDEFLQAEFGANIRAITRSAVTGMGASLFIRGFNSLKANAQPLFVVDGVIWNNLYDVSSIHDGFFSNPLANIENSDIESITVLKDGVSMYGSKAANGVIIINTKRGKDQTTKINLNIITGITTQPKSIPVMGADDYKIYISEMVGTAGLTNNDILQLPYLSEDQARSTYILYHNNTKWSNDIYQNAISKNYSINVKGGDEKAMYYFALGYAGNEGVVKSTDFDRYNLRLNGDINLSKAIKLGINIGFSRIDRKLIDVGLNDNTSPTWISQIKSPFLSGNTFTSLGEKTTEYAFADIFNIGNPLAIIDFSNNTLKQSNFNISLKPEFNISKGFLLTEHFNYNLNKTNEDYYRPYLFTDPIFIQGIGKSYNARMSQVFRNNSIFSDTRLNFTKQINNYNSIIANIGTRYIVNNFESDYVEGHNSMSNSSINLYGGFKKLQTSGVNNINKSLSHYANVDYNFDNRYFINAAMSIDGSSRFGNETESGFSLFGHSFGIFPSINGAWLASSEQFMKNLPFISFFKIRAGYGITGNDDIEDYQTKAYFTAIRFKSIANGIVLSNLENNKIQWETTGRANFGIDLSLLNDRVSITADVFSSITSNLLLQKDFQDVAGISRYWSNDGSLSNKGFELALNVKLLNLRNFQWELGSSLGHYKNEIIELNNNLPIITNVLGAEVYTGVGNAAGVFYGYKTNGVYATSDEAAEANLKILTSNGVYSNFGAGDVIFDDKMTNGVQDGIINENDKQIIGDPNPDFYGSVTNKLTYKKLTFSALFTYCYGNEVYNLQRNLLESGANYNNQSTVMHTRWTSEGQHTMQPKAIYGDPMGNARFSDRWIEDGSYIRLKTLSLAYDIPLKNRFIENINVWVSANNIFTLTNYLGADPEFSAGNAVLYQGVDAGLLPLSKSFYIGLKFNL